MMVGDGYYPCITAWQMSLRNIYDYLFESEMAHLLVYSQLTVSNGFGKQNNQILFKLLT